MEVEAGDAEVVVEVEVEVVEVEVASALRRTGARNAFR